MGVKAFLHCSSKGELDWDIRVVQCDDLCFISGTRSSHSGQHGVRSLRGAQVSVRDKAGQVIFSYTGSNRDQKYSGPLTAVLRRFL